MELQLLLKTDPQYHCTFFFQTCERAMRGCSSGSVPRVGLDLRYGGLSRRRRCSVGAGAPLADSRRGHRPRRRHRRRDRRHGLCLFRHSSSSKQVGFCELRDHWRWCCWRSYLRTRTRAFRRRGIDAAGRTRAGTPRRSAARSKIEGGTATTAHFVVPGCRRRRLVQSLPAGQNLGLVFRSEE